MYNRSLSCSDRRMKIESLVMVKNAVLKKDMLLPLLAVMGLLAIWVLVVIVCLYFGHAYEGSIVGKVLLKRL